MQYGIQLETQSSDRRHARHKQPAASRWVCGQGCHAHAQVAPPPASAHLHAHCAPIHPPADLVEVVPEGDDWGQLGGRALLLGGVCVLGCLRTA